MDAVIQNINVGIPKNEMRLFRELAKKMGWEIHTPESVLDAYEISKVRYSR